MKWIRPPVNGNFSVTDGSCLLFSLLALLPCLASLMLKPFKLG